jgi:hypothetical protein
MSNETAAAILTKLAFEQNTKLRRRLTQSKGKEKELASVMMFLFRQILAEMEMGRQTQGKVPPAVPDGSGRRGRKGPQSNLRRATKGHDRSDEREIGGEG